MQNFITLITRAIIPINWNGKKTFFDFARRQKIDNLSAVATPLENVLFIYKLHLKLDGSPFAFVYQFKLRYNWKML